MDPKVFKREQLLMGNRFEISVVASKEAFAMTAINAAITEIQRIEAVLTTFRSNSITNQINDNAGIAPVSVPEEVYQLIERSLRISRITQGAFDISYGSIDRSLWNFDTSMKKLPDTATARKMTRLINYRNILLDPDRQTVFLAEKGMRIGFGGIGKGYAAEKAKEVLKAMGITDGIVNASGDLAVWGHQPGGTAWTVGIAHPDAAEYPFSLMELSNSAVATSGNYEKFVWVDGKKYSHTIDPKTGLPVTGIKSVTIFSPNAELCDALATPVTIMGIEAGLHLVNQLKEVECVLIDDHNRLYTSNNIQLS